MKYDLNTKVPTYASHGVREYWVVNAVTLATLVHREPVGERYGEVEEVSPDRPLVPLLVPGFALSLAALRL